MTAGASLEAAFQEHRPFLWSLVYRLTGCAADADDVVQDTFVRTLASPPKDTGRPWRPWLTRVALNLGRDVLRSRRRRGYVGPWLPSPVDTGPGDEPPSFDPPDLAPGPAARYDLTESVSVAFLLALEALTPRQRAVLLLRDVLDYSVRETAEALEMSDANTKTTHLRARRAMTAYDSGRCPPGIDLKARTGLALQRFLEALGARDAESLEALLAADARMSSDGGGEFIAARRVVVGRAKVARFLLGLRSKLAGEPRVELRYLNGLPGVVLTATAVGNGWAPRVAFSLLLDPAGRVSHVVGTLATRKLAGLAAGAPRS